MTRIPFSQVLKNAGIDYRREYDRLYTLFCVQKSFDNYGQETTLKRLCADNFIGFPFRGTCISLDDFNGTYGFYFDKNPSDFDLNYLVRFCEYSYNLAIYCSIIPNMHFYIQHVLNVIEKIGYMGNSQGGLTDFVPKDQAAIAVSEIVDSSLSYKVIEYNHHSMKGDIERKKEILLALADKLEPQRNKLKSINSTLEDNLFYLFNNVNIRHNNSDPRSSKYKPKIEKLTAEELEQWYDDTYQMCLLAFMELDNVERKDKVKQLKKEIDG